MLGKVRTEKAISRCICYQTIGSAQIWDLPCALQVGIFPQYTNIKEFPRATDSRTFTKSIFKLEIILTASFRKIIPILCFSLLESHTKSDWREAIVEILKCLTFVQTILILFQRSNQQLLRLGLH